jgi:hypothetical protein
MGPLCKGQGLYLLSPSKLDKNIKKKYQECVLAIFFFHFPLNDLKTLLNEYIYDPNIYNFYVYHCFLLDLNPSH